MPREHVPDRPTHRARRPHPGGQRVERLGIVGQRELDGVRWINDSKGTNVDATLKSLEGFPDGSVFLILGGKDKGADWASLAPLAADLRAAGIGGAGLSLIAVVILDREGLEVSIK